MEGYGVYTFAHQGRYEGHWAQAVYDGVGMETFAKGECLCMQGLQCNCKAKLDHGCGGAGWCELCLWGCQGSYSHIVLTIGVGVNNDRYPVIYRAVRVVQVQYKSTAAATLTASKAGPWPADVDRCRAAASALVALLQRKRNGNMHMHGPWHPHPRLPIPTICGPCGGVRGCAHIV